MKEKINLFWFRRDLRIADNHGFYRALTSGRPVLPVFIYDTNIINDLEDDDSRVEFISMQVNRLKTEFERNNSTLWVFHGKPLAAFKRLWVEYEIDTVFTNEDYEPYARERDERIRTFLNSGEVSLHPFKDQLVFHKDEVVKSDGKPYTVFTPYRKKWLQKLNDHPSESYPSEKYLHNLLKTEPMSELTLRDLGFRSGKLEFPEKEIDVNLLKEYSARRDFPAQEGTSHLGIHLRFGTISIRQLTRKAMQHSSVFLNELIWRNFYMDILLPAVYGGI